MTIHTSFDIEKWCFTSTLVLERKLHSSSELFQGAQATHTIPGSYFILALFWPVNDYRQLGWSVHWWNPNAGLKPLCGECYRMPFMFHAPRWVSFVGRRSCCGHPTEGDGEYFDRLTTTDCGRHVLHLMNQASASNGSSSTVVGGQATSQPCGKTIQRLRRAGARILMAVFEGQPIARGPIVSCCMAVVGIHRLPPPSLSLSQPLTPTGLRKGAKRWVVFCRGGKSS